MLKRDAEYWADEAADIEWELELLDNQEETPKPDPPQIHVV